MIRKKPRKQLLIKESRPLPIRDAVLFDDLPDLDDWEELGSVEREKIERD